MDSVSLRSVIIRASSRARLPSLAGPFKSLEWYGEQMTIQARRHYPRVRLTESACLNFAAGIRATILDVSETGLRFKAASRFQSAGSRKLKFAFNRGGEVAADLAWTDESSMTGGLRFENVSPEVRGQIRQWLDQSWTRQRMVRGSAEPAALAALYQSAARAFDGAVFTETQIVAPAAPLIEPSAVEASQPAAPERKGRGRSISSREPRFEPDFVYFPQRRGRRRLAAAALALLVLLTAATAAAGYFYPNETRDVMQYAHDAISRLFTRASGNAAPNPEPAAVPAGSDNSRE